MVSSDHKPAMLLSLAAPIALLLALAARQWRSTACSFEAAGPGLFLCRQQLLKYSPQAALVRVSATEGWPWTRRQVGGG